MAQYPSLLPTFTTKVNDIDVVDASHINIAQDEVIALATEIGTSPSGTSSNLAARLNAQFNGSGFIFGSDGFPANTTPQRFWYRTDEETLYIAKSDGSGFSAISSAFSNIIYRYTGVDQAEASFGEYAGTSTSPGGGATPQNRFLFSDGVSFGTILNFKLTKLSGMNTVTIHSRKWVESGTGSLRVTIGSVAATVAETAVAPTWGTTNTLDISALGAGTTFNGVIELKSSSNGVGAYCSAVDLIAS